MTKRTAIIGGAGFIGTALAARLIEAGQSVHVLDLPSRLERAAPFLRDATSVAFDFPDLGGLNAALDGASAVVHLACTTTPASSMSPLSRDAMENIAPSVAIFEAAGRAGVKRVLFSSSGGTVYGNPERVPVREDDAGGALSGYGVSKLAIESYLRLEAQQAGFDGVSLRIGNPYGPYQLQGTSIGVIARFLSDVRDGRPLEVWGDGSVIRDYIYIDDVVQAMQVAIEAPTMPSGIYNIGSAEGKSLNEIIEVVADVTGRAPQVNYTPARGFDVAAIVLDNRLFRDTTGWAPQTSLSAGVRRLWEICKSQG